MSEQNCLSSMYGMRIVAGVMDFQTVSALCMKIIQRYH